MTRRIVVVLLVVAVPLVVPAGPADAETIASGPDRNDVVTITVPIDCVGCEGMKAPDGKTDLDQHWKQTAEKAWNRAFKRWKYCGRYRLELDIDIQNVAADAGASFGRHRVTADPPDGRGGATAGFGGAPEQTPEGLPGQRAPDGTRYYEFDAEGGIPVDATETVIIHELGHLLGLGDDRDDAGNVLPGREGTMMVGGAHGVTPDTELKIDSSLVDRIGHQVNNLGVVSCGWVGTITGVGENRGIAACPDPSSHSGEFTIVVRAGGKATLTGHMVNTGVCGPGRTETSFTLEGERIRSRLRFPASPNFPFPVNLRISGNRATGSDTVNPGNDGVYFVTLDFTAKCVRSRGC